MFLMYVDESGDTGLADSPTRYFVLTGLVIHELRWQQSLDQLIAFRRRMREKYGLKLREEIHASEMIGRTGQLGRIPKHCRLAIVRDLADELSGMMDLNVINVVVDKSHKRADYDVFGSAWRALIQRFEDTLSHRNFSGPANPDERGMILPDHTDDKKLAILLRQMRRWNPIPNQPEFGPGYRNRTLRQIIEDPAYRDSRHSYFIQSCDALAYLLKQWLAPNGYMKKKGGHAYFERLDPILCKVASTNDARGVVRL